MVLFPARRHEQEQLQAPPNDSTFPMQSADGQMPPKTFSMHRSKAQRPTRAPQSSVRPPKFPGGHEPQTSTVGNGVGGGVGGGVHGTSAVTSALLHEHAHVHESPRTSHPASSHVGEPGSKGRHRPSTLLHSPSRTAHGNSGSATPHVPHGVDTGVPDAGAGVGHTTSSQYVFVPLNTPPTKSHAGALTSSLHAPDTQHAPSHSNGPSVDITHPPYTTVSASASQLTTSQRLFDGEQSIASSHISTHASDAFHGHASPSGALLLYSTGHVAFETHSMVAFRVQCDRKSQTEFSYAYPLSWQSALLMHATGYPPSS